ncbi:uncharacterized protein MYCFIDRAFT_173893 [Pseudocercospora fijiensis CIRAD86]|uniref:MADS-box domain-containing protein n=1 Tax=Pseudocercospora fijiensis (strain CIRAD86) TaxID=383855 RepID=M3AKB0_PSEFD|nr:uncharacterized protein MYCFIDRAFT_173893 [Pseudocercospora fijiensis CIRAD86]EME85021.1 hypothetical protein MYCFIDRAFT_173893 [Pseudocercospora fijiensis CIRAD86]
MKTFQLRYGLSQKRANKRRKRRITLINKAHELATKCEAQVYVLIRYGGRYYTYSSLDKPSWPPSPHDIQSSSYPLPVQLTACDLSNSDNAGVETVGSSLQTAKLLPPVPLPRSFSDPEITLSEPSEHSWTDTDPLGHELLYGQGEMEAYQASVVGNDSSLSKAAIAMSTLSPSMTFQVLAWRLPASINEFEISLPLYPTIVVGTRVNDDVPDPASYGRPFHDEISVDRPSGLHGSYIADVQFGRPPPELSLASFGGRSSDCDEAVMMETSGTPKLLMKLIHDEYVRTNISFKLSTHGEEKDLGRQQRGYLEASVGWNQKIMALMTAKIFTHIH